MSLRWPRVVVVVVAGAHCAHIGTVGRAERRSGPVCGAPWPRSRQIPDAPVPRTAGHGKKTVGEVFSQDRVQQRLVKQTIEVRKGSVEQFFELLEPQMVQQLEVPKIVVGVRQCLLLELGLLRPERDTADEAAAAVEVLVGEARPPAIAEHSVTNALVPRERVQQRTAVPQSPEETAPELAVSSGKAVSPWSTDGGTNSAAATADAMLAGETRLPGIAKLSAATKLELAKSPGGAGPSWSRAHGMYSVRVRVRRVEFAESCDEEAFPYEEGRETRALDGL